MFELVESKMLMVPLSKLNPIANGVRRTNGIAIDNLAASIKAEGLLQNLTVVVDRESPLAGAEEFQGYQVIAGSRRLRAMRKLVADGDWPPDREVPCKLVEQKQALSASLAENVIREPMHPADEFIAFREMIQGGASIDDVAARFGVTPLAVQRRLRLADVSPKLFELYREDGMTLEQITALAISDDHKAQEKAWFKAANEDFQEPEALRAALTKKEISFAEDPLARFVGRQAYEDQGGTTHVDLFDDANAGYAVDVPLLRSLAGARLEAAAGDVKREGWSWVEVNPQFGAHNVYYYSRAEPSGFKKPDDAEAKIIVALETEAAQIRKRAQEIEDAELDTHDNAEYTKLTTRDDEIDAQLRELKDARAKFDAKAYAQCGAIVSINKGQLVVYRGLCKGKYSPPAQRASSDDKPKTAAKPGHSEALDVDLTSHITAAMAAELIANPGMAIIALVHRLLLQTFYDDFYHDLVKISRDIGYTRKAELSAKDSPDVAKLEMEHAAIKAMLPKKAQLLAWLQSKDAPIARLLAYCIASNIDATSTGALRAQAADLAKALKLDMSSRWTARAANYFSRVSADTIRGCLKDAGVSKTDIASTDKMQKAELAKYAEKTLASKKWLPKIMRSGAAA